MHGININIKVTTFMFHFHYEGPSFDLSPVTLFHLRQ